MQKYADSSFSQRLSLEKLKVFEALEYGMFIHFGMSTFVQNELPDGSDDPKVYAPGKLDVDQWVCVARDAGMKYAILTTKHVAGHCLWNSKYTDYTVANSANKTNVLEEFCNSCEKRGVLPGFYYCSWDNHNRFGSKVWTPDTPADDTAPMYTSSIYQTFQTNQITELLTQFGPVAEMWVDIPVVLGRGYRTFLYHHIASLQPDTVIMMNNGICDGSFYDVEYAWPSDIIAIERNVPPVAGHVRERWIEGKKYYMPGEVCDTIGKEWFWVEGDLPRQDDELLKQYLACRSRNANFLLDVPPNRDGIIPDYLIKSLMNLKKNASI